MAADQKITEVVEFNPPRGIKRGTVAPFVDMAALPENQRDIAYVSEREFSGGGARFQNGDTLFSRITPCLENGKTAKVNVLPAGSIAHGSTEFIVMAAKAPEYDEDYIYYLARHPEFRAFAERGWRGHLVGSAYRGKRCLTFAFFLKQKTAYEITRGHVSSRMFVRDSSLKS
ncbi:hypothetical protein [Alcaligenes sp. Marseille-Q7550]